MISQGLVKMKIKKQISKKKKKIESTLRKYNIVRLRQQSFNDTKHDLLEFNNHVMYRTKSCTDISDLFRDINDVIDLCSKK